MQDIESAGATETVDKRLHMYRALRDQMLSGLRVDQELENRARMNELNKKIEALERSQRQKEALEQATKEQKEQERGQKNKGFLEGIKSFQVEDI